MLRKLLREPLLHFLLLGLLLFLLFNLISGRQGGADRRIVINDAEVGSLVQTFQGTWQRPPTMQELRGLIDSRIREEVLYREGAALGLDRDDAVIRRRVLQKLDVISEESQSQEAPSDAVLGAWLQQHEARYAQPAVLNFEQVLFDPVRHGTKLKADVDAALARLRAGADPAKVGDQSLLPTRASASPADMVARDFGEQFASALIAAPLGVSAGPGDLGLRRAPGAGQPARSWASRRAGRCARGRRARLGKRSQEPGERGLPQASARVFRGHRSGVAGRG